MAFLNQFGRLFSKQVHLNMSLNKRVSHNVGESMLLFADNGVHVFYRRVRICDREEGREHR